MNSIMCMGEVWVKHRNMNSIMCMGEVWVKHRNMNSIMCMGEIFRIMLQQTSTTDYGQLRCLVCSDKASGLHYGVVSCESCKSFFGRKIKSKAKFSCEEGGNCVMDLYTRRHCPACRLNKCLDVGMKPERVWDDKRLETRKPLVRKARRKREELSPLPTPPPPAPLPSTVSVNPESTSSCEDFGAELSIEHQDLLDTVCNGLELSRKLHRELITPDKLQSILTGISAYFAEEQAKAQRSGGEFTKPFEIPVKSEHPQFPPGGFASFGSLPPPPPPSSSSLSSSSNYNRTGAPSNFDFPSNKIGAPGASLGSAFVKVKQENDDTSPCQCSRNIAMPFPTPAQQSNFLPPGTDSFDKTQLVVFNMALLGVVIRQTVQFAKCLPGFRYLTYEDQAVLIKAAILEVLMFRMAETYIPERNCVVDDVTGTEWDFGIMMQSGFASSAEKTLRFTKSVYSFHLLRAEMALLEAATLLAPDRPELQQPETVEELQQNILMALQASTKVNHPNDKVLFAKLIVKLAEVRELVQSHIIDLNELKLPDHEKIFPLIAEIFNMDEGLMCNSIGSTDSSS
ncbi:vitamin D3 receptor B-like [Glandiceps talaboti]